MDTPTEKIVSDNQKTWNLVCDLFADASALPDWGPFGIGADLDLIPEIKGKTFLEIGCGSGRSIKYLMQEDAERVYGLDLSPKQIEEASRYNRQEIEDGKVVLIQSQMENKIDIEPVDFVISVYAIGWTVAPEKVFSNIYSYLKPGGVFIWSWDHSIFTDIEYKDGGYYIEHSYHEEKPVTLIDWKKRGTTAHITYRKTSTWFRLLRDAGFNIIGYHEPAPKNLNRGHDDPEKYYSIQKAKKMPCSFIFVCQN